MDVKQPEPLPWRALSSLPNVIITPHVGGQTVTRIDDMTNFFCKNLRRHLVGNRWGISLTSNLVFPFKIPRLYGEW